MRGVEHALPCMRYPYMYIGEEDLGSYTLKDIRRFIITETEMADAGDFPKNITEHYWIRPGENDGDSWIACGLLNNGSYFFYTGSCDFTGFDCQGGMSLWVSQSWANIVDHAMSRANYQLYLEQTEVPPAEGEEPWVPMTEQQFWDEQRRHIRCDHCEKEGANREHPFGIRALLCEDCYKSLTTTEEPKQEERKNSFEGFILEAGY
jgi:hypothetical protein